MVFVPIVALLAAAFFVHRQQSVYRASMGILVAQGGGSVQPQLGNVPLTQTMTNILESDVIATQVTRELKLRISPSGLLKRISVQVKPDSSVLNVSYDSPNKRRAVEVLGVLGTAFKSLIRQQLGVSGSFNQTGPLRIVVSIFNPPHLQPGRVSPRPTKTYAFAGALGLVLGVILAFARDALDDRVRGRRQAEESLGGPVIGVLPKGILGARGFELSAKRRTPGIEALDLLSASVRLQAAELGPALLVTGAAEDDDTSAVVANLGLALAQGGQYVLCVEADERRSKLRKLLGFPAESVAPTSGLTGVLDGKVTVSDAITHIPVGPSRNGGDPGDGTRGSHLMLLPAGAVESANPAGVMSPERLARVVQDLSGRANYVLFDCPRLAAVAHGLPLASLVDGVLVVAREGRTRRARAEALRAVLEALGVKNVMVVLIVTRSSKRARSAV
jgi:capsular polysaccharide biosynthesis protein/MinD-like ATPase involved in chromosome partitioning or flagellar assembly